MASKLFAYRPGLDGIRGYSMVVFMLWHVGVLTFLPGAWILMNVFFILSAFLITRLLLAEQREFGWISVREFYRRRVRRLAPALLVMVGAVTLDGWAFAPAAERTYLRGDILATLTYVMNWRLVLRDDQYFEEFTHPSITRHAWSLSVEEQFYLVVPLLIIAALTYAHRRSARTAGFVVLALASAAWRRRSISTHRAGRHTPITAPTCACRPSPSVSPRACGRGIVDVVVGCCGHGIVAIRSMRETAGSRSSAGSASSRRSQASRSSSR